MPGLTQKSLTSLRLDTHFLKPVPHHITETHSNGAEKLQSSCQSYTNLISLLHFIPRFSKLFTGKFPHYSTDKQRIRSKRFE